MVSITAATTGFAMMVPVRSCVASMISIFAAVGEEMPGLHHLPSARELVTDHGGDVVRRSISSRVFATVPYPDARPLGRRDAEQWSTACQRQRLDDRPAWSCPYRWARRCLLMNFANVVATVEPSAPRWNERRFSVDERRRGNDGRRTFINFRPAITIRPKRLRTVRCGAYRVRALFPLECHSGRALSHRLPDQDIEVMTCPPAKALLIT